LMRTFRCSWRGSDRSCWATSRCRRGGRRRPGISTNRARLGEEAAFADRLFDPGGLRPPIWFQEVPETKAGKNRLHVDMYPTGRDNALPLERRDEIVEPKAPSWWGWGRACSGAPGTTTPDDPIYYVVMDDPEGNEFCVS
jgi:hypothetical protein